MGGSPTAPSLSFAEPNGFEPLKAPVRSAG